MVCIMVLEIHLNARIESIHKFVADTDRKDSATNKWAHHESHAVVVSPNASQDTVSIGVNITLFDDLNGRVRLISVMWTEIVKKGGANLIEGEVKDIPLDLAVDLSGAGAHNAG